MNVKPPAGSALYETLARVYDLTGQSRFSLKMVSYLLEILALRRAKPRRIIDLACGTGAAAVALANRKFEVTGVDGSAAMLGRARARAARWKVQVDWSQQSLTELDLPQAYELATCFYDSLNHLTNPYDLKMALFGVRRLLVPGGLFFFDMNTRYALEHVWNGISDTHVDADYARFWRSAFDPETGLGRLETTYFVRDEDDRYTRVEAVHTARGYDPDEVKRALEDAGFTLLEAYECQTFEPAGPDTYRVAYLAQA
jgi:ubiquinone/menaquinone biosynthesis C-methylase UbiE